MSVTVTTTNEYVLPTVDLAYRTVHLNDTPFMLYPNEVVKDYGDDYCLTNYGRIYNKKTQHFIKNIRNKTPTKLMQELFTAEELDNDYYRSNIRTRVSTYYSRHRAERLAYQRQYRAANLEAVRERERLSHSKRKQQQQQQQQH